MDFSNNFYYHIYNRGVDKRKVFLDKWDYLKFLEQIKEFNQVSPVFSLYWKNKKRLISGSTAPIAVEPQDNKKLINLIAYCLNPNHYHLLVKQCRDGGISEFMKKVGGGYTWYFNHKNNRSGSLFQGRYKVKEIKSTYGLLKLSVYVNCNAEVHNIAKKEDWPWSSYGQYVDKLSGRTASIAVRPQVNFEVLEEFKNVEEYKKFCEDLLPDIKAVKNLERYGLE